MSLKEAQEKLVENMKRWQKVEDASVSSTGAIIEKTDNPIIRLVMQIIQQDSQMHYHVQQLIRDSLESKVLKLTPDELGEIWDMVEKHIRIEQETIQLAKDSLKQIEGSKGMVVQAYLLQYLLKDEEKHDAILETLSTIKKGMYPYG